MIKKLLLFTLLIFCFIKKSDAQGIGGGEIYYEQLGPKKYKVTAHIYRMCEFSPLNFISAYVIGKPVGSPSIQIFFNMTRVSIKKINDTCGNPCKVQNVASTPGY